MLELNSNTIKVLGIFGRLSPAQESYFDTMEAKYSKKPTKQGFDIFRHLTLTFAPNASITDVRNQLELLRDIKTFLPVKLNVEKIFVKDEESLPGVEHIAIEFGLEQTKSLFIVVSVMFRSPLGTSKLSGLFQKKIKKNSSKSYLNSKL